MSITAKELIQSLQQLPPDAVMKTDRWNEVRALRFDAESNVAWLSASESVAEGEVHFSLKGARRVVEP